jgi:hypothetical protein
MNVLALRRALHQAVDLVCDALTEDAEAKPAKRRRGPATPVIPDVEVSPEALARAEERLSRAGYRKVG